MTITSFAYLTFILVGGCIYYILPKKMQWLELLALSIVFYCVVANPYTLIFPIIATLLAYSSTLLQQTESVKRAKWKYTGCTIVTLAVILCVSLWFWLKASDIWVSVSYRISNIVSFVQPLSAPSVLAALGMGYYTLQIIGYILDCYWGTIQPQRNPLKLFLFVLFFPQMVTGPISRYSQLEGLFLPNKLLYENVTQGAQRILWGFFKKLVLAERVGIIVNSIYGDLDLYNGWWHWIALLLYPIQMYADFSGCTDIALGTAEVFGIQLPENFNNPFFSRTSQEFWQRWHITLGAWAKDYVLYPLLKTKWMVNFGKKAKKKFGKRFGKFISTAIGMFFLWMVMGIWHGSFKYIIGVSLWYWVILMLGELFSPVFEKMVILLKVNTESFSWHLFQSMRTYLIYAIGAVFFRADGFGQAIRFLKSLITMFIGGRIPNSWILFDGSILDFGVSYGDLNITIFAVAMLVIVAVLREKYGYARSWMGKQILVFRWTVWIALFIIVLILGSYGPGYSASEFIYQGF